MKSIDNLFTKIGSYPWREDSDMADFDALVEAVQDEIRENHIKLHALVKATQDEMRESYIKLPLDADDVPIRLGDEVYQVEGGFVYTVNSIRFCPDKTTISFECKHGFGCDIAHNVRHYHAPTVEDVMVEFATDWECAQDGEDKTAVLKEYAAKLRLADDGKEQ